MARYDTTERGFTVQASDTLIGLYTNLYNVSLHYQLDTEDRARIPFLFLCKEVAFFFRHEAHPISIYYINI